MIGSRAARGLRRVLVAVAGAALCAAPRAALADKVHENEALNYALQVPDTWTWPPPESREDDVVEVAQRRLLTLADEKTEGRGRGGRLFLAVADPPRELPKDYEDAVADWQQARAQGKRPEDLEQRIRKDLAGLASLPDVRRILLMRFDEDPAKWPAVTVDPWVLMSKDDTDVAVPAAEVGASGTARNLLGEPMPCEARMFVLVIRKKMVRLVTWIWPSEGDPAAKPPRKADAEDLRTDVDEIQSWFRIPKKEAIRRRPEEAAPGPDKEEAVGDSAEEKPASNLAEGWSLTKPKGFRTTSPDRRTVPADRFTAFRMEASTKAGALALVEVFVHSVDDPAAAPPTPQGRLPEDWRRFLSDHGAGPLTTAPFPRAVFLALPDFAKAKEVKRPPPSESEPANLADLERWGVAEKGKDVRIGKTKVRSPYRTCLRGSRERVGSDTTILWMFSTQKRVFLIRLTAFRDALDLWKAPLQRFLDGFTLAED